MIYAMAGAKDQRVGVTTRRMATARAQAPAVPPPRFDASLDRAAETRRRGKPWGRRRTTFDPGSESDYPKVSEPDEEPPAPDLFSGKKSARLAAKPTKSWATVKRTISKTAASETRGAGASKKTRVSNQAGEPALREPL